MSPGRLFGRTKLNPEEKAEQIKQKYAARYQPQGLFTAAQEDLMEELGLTGDHTPKAKKKSGATPKKKRDPLTARQRRLMQELGLTSSLKPIEDQEE